MCRAAAFCVCLTPAGKGKRHTLCCDIYHTQLLLVVINYKEKTPGGADFGSFDKSLISA